MSDQTPIIGRNSITIVKAYGSTGQPRLLRVSYQTRMTEGPAVKAPMYAKGSLLCPHCSTRLALATVSTGGQMVTVCPQCGKQIHFSAHPQALCVVPRPKHADTCHTCGDTILDREGCKK